MNRPTRSFLMNPVSILLILFLSQCCFDLMGKSVEAVRSSSWEIRNKMLAAMDKMDGCGCYSDDDCKNTPGCGSYCHGNKVPIGMCVQIGAAEE